MKQYQNKYRVCCEWNRKTLAPIRDNTYIKCANDGEIYRINDDTLCYLRPHRGEQGSLIKKLTDLKVEIVKSFLENGDSICKDVCVWFKEKDLDKTIDVFKIRTSGVGIAPHSRKNLRLFKWFKENEEEYRRQGLITELTEEEKAVYRERFEKYVKGKEVGNE